MIYLCKRCKKPLEGTTFFCSECEEQSIQKLAQMMEEELKKKEAEACPFCDCVAINEMGHCEGCGKLTRPPPA